MSQIVRIHNATSRPLPVSDGLEIGVGEAWETTYLNAMAQQTIRGYVRKGMVRVEQVSASSEQAAPAGESAGVTSTSDPAPAAPTGKRVKAKNR